MSPSVGSEIDSCYGSHMAKHTIGRWSGLGLLLLGLILIPFILFGGQIDSWTGAFIDNAESRPLTTMSILGGLLASDILLPIPSSIVSTACGRLLGVTLGALTSWIGMTLSCAIGFALGRGPGAPLGRSLVGREELLRLERLHRRFGAWIVVITRPIPVMAEAAVLLAGMGRMNAGRFFIMTTLSNLGISLAYAAVGAWAAHMNSFLIAFGAAMILPGIAMLFGKKVLRDKPPNKS